MTLGKTSFYKGMDISSLPEQLTEGMELKDMDGSIFDVFALIKKYGVNSIRLRIWNDPKKVPESKGYCSLEETIKMAKRIKENDLHFMLDFHYSDFWADPSHQKKPVAWENLCFSELEHAVYDYTRETLLTLKEEGVLPNIVQIGNEIRSGLLFPEGELPDYEHMVKLVNAGIRGARSVAPRDRMQVMIHLDQGGRYLYLKEWFDHAFANGLEDFDVIGISYYPFWHGTFQDVKESMEKLLVEYKKPIMVVETAHAWRKSEHGFIDSDQERIAGVEATPQGQKKVLDLIMNIVASLPDHMGQGVYYWEPLCLPRNGQGGWSENMGLVAPDGTVMEGIRSFLFTREQTCARKLAKIYVPESIHKTIENDLLLPAEVSVLFYDGTMKKSHVSWYDDALEAKWEKTPGTYELLGLVEEFQNEVTLKVIVKSELTVGENILSDANWDQGLSQWNIVKSDERIGLQLLPEFIDPFPAPPHNALRWDASMNGSCEINSQVMLTKGETYRLSLEYKGIDTTGVDIRIFIDQRKEVIHPTQQEWTKHQVEYQCEKTGVYKVGIHIVSPPGYGIIREIILQKENTGY